MKGYHLDLVRVTEAGAIAAAKWVGRGNKESADKDATRRLNWFEDGKCTIQFLHDPPLQLIV